MQYRVTLLVDAETKALHIDSPLSPAETLMVLERAKMAAVNLGSQPPKPQVEVPPGPIQRHLLPNGVNKG